jgi:hypothetical protein
VLAINSSVKPDIARVKDMITVTPNGAPITCNQTAVLIRRTDAKDEIIGALLPNGGWYAADANVLAIPTCDDTPSDAPVIYTVPAVASPGNYLVCMSPFTNTCGAFTVIE